MKRVRNQRHLLLAPDLHYSCDVAGRTSLLTIAGAIYATDLGVKRGVLSDAVRSLKLTVARGALVQDVTEGSPGDRAGLRPYDIITALDDHAVANDDELIRDISGRAPGSAARMVTIRFRRPRA